MYIGTGIANFTEHHGNFDIQDEVLTKLPLNEFRNVTVGENDVIMTFTTTEDPELMVSERKGEWDRSGRRLGGMLGRRTGEV